MRRGNDGDTPEICWGQLSPLSARVFHPDIHPAAGQDTAQEGVGADFAVTQYAGNYRKRMHS
jgi:hypothetical protein